MKSSFSVNRGAGKHSPSSRGGRVPEPFETHLSRSEYYLVALIILLTALGTLGYELLEGWSLLDSLYMTVITLSTVGYKEVAPLSPAGTVFTIFLIVGGVGIALAILARVANLVLERQLSRIVRGKDMLDEIASLSDHVILCGYGRLSRIASSDLVEAGRKVVVIDIDPSRVEEARSHGLLSILGDASEDEVLQSAALERASCLVCLLPKAAENLYVLLTAREVAPDTLLIARAEQEADEKRLRRAGARRIISPYRTGGQWISHAIVRPQVVEFLELASPRSNVDLQIEEIRIPENSPVAGKTLEGAGFSQLKKLMIAALVSKSGEIVFNPPSDAVLEAQAAVIGLGRKADFKELEQIVFPS